MFYCVERNPQMFCSWVITENMCDCVPQGRPGGPLPQRPSHQPASRIHYRSCTEVRAHTQNTLCLYSPFHTWSHRSGVSACSHMQHRAVQFWGVSCCIHTWCPLGVYTKQPAWVKSAADTKLLWIACWYSTCVKGPCCSTSYYSV